MEDDKLNYLQYRMVQCNLVVGVKAVGLVVIVVIIATAVVVAPAIVHVAVV